MAAGWAEKAEGRKWPSAGEQLGRSRPSLLWWSPGTPRSCEGDGEHGSPQLKEHENILMRREKSDASASLSAYFENRADVREGPEGDRTGGRLTFDRTQDQEELQ